MSHYHPPPPGVDGRSNASRYGPPPAPSGSNSYRPAPPSYAAPPPPPPPSSSRDYDSYAPSRYNDRDRDRGRDRGRDRDDRSDRYAPSRRSDNHQLPPKPSSSYRDYRNGDSFRPPESDFTFRSDKPSGVGDSYNNYRPSDSNGSRNSRRGPARGNLDRPPRFGNDNFRGRYGGPNQPRRVWKPFKPAERAILQSTVNDKPAEDFADAENGVVYRAIDQLSDSDEADMDMSDSENESAEPTAKRARTTNQEATGDSVPKWSNPDPYTALPPTEESDKKKKDMVQLIRKARVQAAPGPRTSLPADDEDFIRCDTDSEGDEENNDEVFIDPLTYKRDKDSGQGNSAPVSSAARASASAQALPPVSQAARAMLPPKPEFSQFNSSAGTGSVQVASQAAQPAANSKRRAADVLDLTASPELGSRKRTYDDVLKLPAHAKLKAPPKRPVEGALISEWKIKPNENPCPWIRAPTSDYGLNTR